MEFKSEELGVRFTVPDAPTVRQQLEYMGTAGLSNDRNWLVRWWEAALTLIDEWECEAIPEIYPAKQSDPDILDTMTSLKQSQIIQWVASKCREYMNSLEETDPN